MLVASPLGLRDGSGALGFWRASSNGVDLYAREPSGDGAVLGLASGLGTGGGAAFDLGGGSEAEVGAALDLENGSGNGGGTSDS